MVRVYFETAGYSELVAEFKSEEVYVACFPSLEKKAREQNFDKVTEIVIDEEN